MRHLFAYGTLMCEDIMNQVSRCRLATVPGVLRGYSRRRVRGKAYPGLIPRDTDLVEGLVYRDVPDPAWERLDRFEGTLYLRRTVSIELENDQKLSAQTYIVRPEFTPLLDDAIWDYAEFLRKGKSIFQSCYEGFRAL
jgi:gamma-glutamylcyclotransferase (GGCT)/AIG2-like uncharacterized protein YtfP